MGSSNWEKKVGVKCRIARTLHQWNDAGGHIQDKDLPKFLLPLLL